MPEELEVKSKRGAVKRNEREREKNRGNISISLLEVRFKDSENEHTK